ncbi:VOC family protein [Dyadobacter bucti]|jgi:predicted lactoylglutathione lyase|uniref:VOC family protein n=1 Tax=Dyadobacter bucti TaxID=2572203 RepID=UPI0011095164|nr:VOC family protein [Dyadobacter bucti]
MATKIFVNLPVKDLNQTVEFFTKLGFTFNAQFTDENATSMIISDDIYVMLLVEKYFQTFTKKEIVDTSKAAEAIICLSADSREEVDALVDKAFAAGAKSSSETQEYGYMYGRGFEDINGHLWEVMWMDPGAVEPQA